MWLGVGVKMKGYYTCKHRSPECSDCRAERKREEQRDWRTMRNEVFEVCEQMYGKLSKETNEKYKNTIKRLESIWRKDKELYSHELEILRRLVKINANAQST